MRELRTANQIITTNIIGLIVSRRFLCFVIIYFDVFIVLVMVTTWNGLLLNSKLQLTEWQPFSYINESLALLQLYKDPFSTIIYESCSHII